MRLVFSLSLYNLNSAHSGQKKLGVRLDLFFVMSFLLMRGHQVDVLRHTQPTPSDLLEDLDSLELSLKRLLSLLDVVSGYVDKVVVGSLW